MSPCTNGGGHCPRGASIMVRIGIRSTDERPVCGPCAEAMFSLYPQQRPIPGIPEWMRRAANHTLPAQVRSVA